MAKSKKKKWFVVALNEDGHVSLYGPYKYQRAHNEAEDIFLADPSGNTVTEVTQALKKWRYKGA